MDLDSFENVTVNNVIQCPDEGNVVWAIRPTKLNNSSPEIFECVFTLHSRAIQAYSVFALYVFEGNSFSWSVTFTLCFGGHAVELGYCTCVLTDPDFNFWCPSHLISGLVDRSSLPCAEREKPKQTGINGIFSLLPSPLSFAKVSLSVFLFLPLLPDLNLIAQQ